MTLTSPFWMWLFAATAGIVIYVHTRRTIAEPHTVSSTLLWRLLNESMQQTQRRRRMRATLILLLQLLTLLVIALVMAGPRLPVTIAPVTVGVILDNSASMDLSQDGTTRFEATVEQARALLHEVRAERYALWTTAPPHVSIQTDSKDELLERLAHIPPPGSESVSRWDDVFHSMEALAGHEHPLKLFIFSDGAASPAFPQWFIDLANTGHVSYAQVGTPTDNMGITSFSSRPLSDDIWDREVAVTVGNFSGESSNTALVVRTTRDDTAVEPLRQQIQLDPGEERSIIFRHRFAHDETMNIFLNVNEPFDADDSVTIRATERNPTEIILVADESPFLESMFRSMPRVDLLPRRHIDQESHQVRHGQIVIFDGIPVPDGFTGQALSFAPAGHTNTAQDIVWWDQNHPFFRFVDWQNIEILSGPANSTPQPSGSRELSGSAFPPRVLVQGSDGPLVTLRQSDNSRIVEFAFSLEESNLPYEIDFPILMHNIVSEMGETDQQLVWVEEGLLSAAESDLSPRLVPMLDRIHATPLNMEVSSLQSLLGPDSEPSRQSVRPDLWRAAAGVVLLLLIIEGWLYYYGGSLKRRHRPTIGGVRRLAPAMRAASVLLLICIVAGITYARLSQSLTLHILLDDSLSMDRAGRDIAEDIAGHIHSLDIDNAHVMTYLFARNTVPFHALDLMGDSSRIDRGETNIERALMYVARNAPQHDNNRIILISDGQQTTGDATNATVILRDSHIPVDTVITAAPDRSEVYVDRLVLPQKVTPLEPYDIHAVIVSTSATPANVTLYEDGTLVQTETTLLQAGTNTVTFSRFGPSADHTVGDTVSFEVRVDARDDTIMENNQYYGVVSTDRAAEILIVARDVIEGESLRSALVTEGLNVTTLPHHSLLLAHTIHPYRAIVFIDVPLTNMPSESIRHIADYVRQGGGGLLAIGGPNSFGMGQYENTALEDVLPVTTDADHDVASPSVALVLALDTSGSMRDLQHGFSKLDLAKEASLGTLELMHRHDHIGVIGFDSEARWVVPLQSVENYDTIASRIATLAPSGGTNVGAALLAATPAMEQSDASVKHLIVLTDGRSSSADFQRLTDDLTQLGVTVSTIGIGMDADLDLLRNMAQWGNGRFYFTDDIRMIPQIFLTETTVISRPIIDENPFYPIWNDSAAFWDDDAAVPMMGGFIKTTAKPSANVPLVSEDGHPILAHHRAGLGHSAALLSNVAGNWAGDWRGWSGYAPFLSQLIRSIMRETEPTGLFTSMEVVDGQGQIIVDAINDDGAFINFMQLTAEVTTPGGDTITVPISQSAPGRYEGFFQAHERGAYASYIHDLQEERVVSTIGTIVPYSGEYRPVPSGQSVLASLSEQTNGRHYIADSYDNLFTGLMSDVDRSTRQPVAPYLFPVVFMLFFIDIMLRYIRSRPDKKYEQADATEKVGSAEVVETELHQRIAEDMAHEERRARRSPPPSDQASIQLTSEARRFLAEKRQRKSDLSQDD